MDTPLVPNFLKLPKEERLAAIRKLYPPLPPLPDEPAALPGPGGKPYTLADLQQIAAGNSPTLRQAASDVEAARGNLEAAWAYPNPTLSYLATPSSDGSTPGVQGFLIDQTIKTGGKLKLQAAAAQKALENAQLALKRAAQRPVHPGAQRLLRPARRQGNRPRRRRRWPSFTDEVYLFQEDLLEHGFAAPYEPAVLRAQAYTARLAYAQAVQNYIYAWKQLVAAVGLRQLPLTEVAGRIDAFIPYYDYDTVLAHVLRNHTDVLTAHNGIDAARYNLKLAQVTPVGPGRQRPGRRDEGLRRRRRSRSRRPRRSGCRSRSGTRTGAIIRPRRPPWCGPARSRTASRLVLTNNLATAYAGYKNNLDALEYYRKYILPDQVRTVRGIEERRRFDVQALSLADLVDGPAEPGDQRHELPGRPRLPVDVHGERGRPAANGRPVPAGRVAGIAAAARPGAACRRCRAAILAPRERPAVARRLLTKRRPRPSRRLRLRWFPPRHIAQPEPAAAAAPIAPAPGGRDAPDSRTTPRSTASDPRLAAGATGKGRSLPPGFSEIPGNLRRRRTRERPVTRAWESCDLIVRPSDRTPRGRGTARKGKETVMARTACILAAMAVLAGTPFAPQGYAQPPDVAPVPRTVPVDAAEYNPLPGLPRPPDAAAFADGPGDAPLRAGAACRGPTLSGTRCSTRRRCRRPAGSPTWTFSSPRPHVKNQLTNASLRGGAPDVVSLPSAPLDWTVAPRFEMGRTLPSGFGAVAVSYRFLPTRGPARTTGFDGPAVLKSRLDLNIADLDYISREFSLWPNWDMTWRLGGRTAWIYFDSRADESFAAAAAGSGVFEQRTSDSFVGFGPHTGVEVARRFTGTGLSLFAEQRLLDQPGPHPPGLRRGRRRPAPAACR